MTDIRSLIEEETGAKHLGDDETLAELGLDSLDQLELVINIEKKTGIEAPKEAKFRTVGSLVEFFGRN